MVRWEATKELSCGDHGCCAAVVAQQLWCRARGAHVLLNRALQVPDSFPVLVTMCQCISALALLYTYQEAGSGSLFACSFVYV
jgi:hypothetical protein